MYISADRLFFQKNVESSTNAGETHLVVYGKNQFEEGSGAEKHLREWSCTCPDFQFRGKKTGKYCKHILQTLALSVENGGWCDWDENSGLEPVYLKDKNGNYQPFAPFKRNNGEWVKAVFVPDSICYDEFDIEDKKVIVVYMTTDVPEEIKTLLHSSEEILTGILGFSSKDEEVVENDIKVTYTYVSDENLPPITITRSVSPDTDFPRQNKPILGKK